MKSHVRALGALLCLISAPLGGPASAGIRSAEAAEANTASACVGFQNQVADKQLIIHASNDCELRLACTLDYSVRCEDNQGHVTSRAQKQSPFKLAPKGQADLTLSAEACQRQRQPGWAIDELIWNCR